VLPAGYPAFLESLKSRVQQAQTKAMLSVNRELIKLYWDIGRQIAERQEQEGWGKNVVDRLAADIQKAFPGIRGFSASNVSRMRAFFLAYARGRENSAQAVPKLPGKKLARAVPKPASKSARLVRPLPNDQPPAPLGEIPWGHNVVLLFKLSDPAERLWYAAKTVEHGWSRAVLTVQIEGDLYGRQGKATSNFAGTLPPTQSDLAQQALKDPYLST
jgi:predicted nuclease of restriction endonuclease-like (RecB) superfamily